MWTTVVKAMNARVLIDLWREREMDFLVDF